MFGVCQDIRACQALSNKANFDILIPLDKTCHQVASPLNHIILSQKAMGIYVTITKILMENGR